MAERLDFVFVEKLVLFVSLVGDLLLLELYLDLHLCDIRLRLFELISEDPDLVFALPRFVCRINHLFGELCILLPHFF